MKLEARAIPGMLKICILTCLLLLLGLFFPERASATATISLPDVSARKGETVSMSVILNSEDVYSGSFNICFDDSALEFVQAEKTSNLIGALNQTQADTIRANFASTSALQKNTKLFVLTFRVTSNTPTSGSPVYFENIRFYDIDGVAVDCQSISGTISRYDLVQLSLGSTEAVPYQSVQVPVFIGGDVCPAGGSFFVEYDADLLTPTAVLPGEAIGHSQFLYHSDSPGTLKIAFAGIVPCSAGTLCNISFQIKGTEPTKTELNLSNVLMHDEQANRMTITYSPRSSITIKNDHSATIAGKKLTITLGLKIPANTSGLLAAYDENAKMLGVLQGTVVSDHSIVFATDKLLNSAELKLFLTDSYSAPIQHSRIISIE